MGIRRIKKGAREAELRFGFAGMETERPERAPAPKAKVPSLHAALTELIDSAGPGDDAPEMVSAPATSDPWGTLEDHARRCKGCSLSQIISTESTGCSTGLALYAAWATHRDAQP